MHMPQSVNMDQVPLSVSSASFKERWLRKERIIPIVVGVLSVCLLPYLHLGLAYQFWTVNRMPVDRQKCTCSCWDSFFKGSYEFGTPRYKHIYFNMTSNTFKIWLVTAICIICLYETACYLSRLLIKQQLRISMFILFIASIYPHYYGWWMYFNYVNDDFYAQWYHQWFFSLTELASTFVILYLADKSKPVSPPLLLIIIDISILHILAAGGDQFITNVFYGRGAGFQFARDVGFMGADVLNVFIAMAEWFMLCKANGTRIWTSVDRYVVLTSCLGIVLLWTICSIL